MRRNNKKNSKFTKILYVVPVLCIIAVGALFYMLFDMNSKIEEKNYGVDTNSSSENTNTIKNNDNNINTTSQENNVINNNSNNTENTIDNNTSNSNNNNSQTQEPTGNLTNSTEKKEQAIEIVKKEWGEENDVLFDCYVNNNGDYIVTISTISGSVISYYKVDLDKKTIEIY